MKHLLSIYRKNRKKAPHAFHDACRAKFQKLRRAWRTPPISASMKEHSETIPGPMQRNAALGKTHVQNPTSAYAYFQDSTISGHQTYQTLPTWVSQVMPATDCDKLIEFDLSAITPGTVRNVLKSRPSNSSPCRGRRDHLPLPPSEEVTFCSSFFGDPVLEDFIGRSCGSRILVPDQDEAHPQMPGSVQSRELSSHSTDLNNR